MKRSRLLGKLLLPAFLQRLLGIPRSSLYGEARWMGFWERRRFLARRHKGLVLSPGGRLSAKESFKNLVLTAPTGTGKTTRYVIPNLLELQGSAVVTDPSGEIYNATSGYLQERGFAIQVLQPAAPERSLKFNPLHYYGNDTELRRLAGVLADTTGGGPENAYWRIGATNALHSGLRAVTALPDPADRTIANVYRLLNALSADEAAADAFMARSLAGEAFGQYRAFIGQDEKTKSYHLSTAQAALELWTDPGVCRFSGSNTVDIGLLRQRPAVIYLIVPRHKVRFYGVLLNLFYSACFEHCIEHAPGPADLPVYFFLDEFGNLGRIADFAGVITTIRKQRCSLSIILQAKTQLDALYGPEDAETILRGGCGHRLYFGGLDLETCRHVEAELGQQTRYDDALPEGEGRKVAAPLLRHDEIRMLPDDRGIILSGGRHPLYGKSPACFRVQRWQRQTERPPVPHPVSPPEAERATVKANGQPYFF